VRTTLAGKRRTPAAHHNPNAPARRTLMLHYAIVFLVIALVAALFGFGGIAAGAVGIAKILFYVFLILAVIAFVMNMGRKG
jgi:uncharacterized membrane protein YtjA (UPF0391 family)